MIGIDSDSTWTDEIDDHFHQYSIWGTHHAYVDEGMVGDQVTINNH